MLTPRRTAPPLPALIVLSICLATLVLPATEAVGDKVWLTNGRVLEGRVLSGEVPPEEDTKVRIELPFGTLTLPAAKVERVELSETLEERIYAELDRLEDDDTEGRYVLALWSREQGSNTLARRLLEQVLRIDPDHDEARRDLGFFRHGDRWLTEEELRTARGQVQVRGQWVSSEQAARLLLEQARSEAARRLAEQEQRARLDEAALWLAYEDAAREPRRTEGLPLYPLAYPSFGFPVAVGGVGTGVLRPGVSGRVHGSGFAAPGYLVNGGGVVRNGPVNRNVQPPSTRPAPRPRAAAPSRNHTTGGRSRYGASGKP